MYWIKLYKDIRLWMKFSKISKENREYLQKHNLRVDWIGRIYTVINLPEDVAKGNEYVQEAWVLENLKPYNEILAKVGLSGYVVPEMRKITDVGTSAFLLVLYPDVETITFKKILFNVIAWPLGFLVLRALYRLSDDLIDYSNIFNKIIEYLF